MKHAILIHVQDVNFYLDKRHAQNQFDFKDFMSYFGLKVEGDETKFFASFMPCIKNYFELLGKDILIFEVNDSMLKSFIENDISCSIIGNTSECDVEFAAVSFEYFCWINELRNKSDDPAEDQTDDFLSQYKEYLDKQINETIDNILALWKKS